MGPALALSLSLALGLCGPGHAAPPRTIALAPHIVELVFAAGAGAALVGVAQGSDHPPAARQLPTIGDGNRPGIEGVLALRPDLVIGWQHPPLRALTPLLDARNIRIEYSDPSTLTGIADDIARLGHLLGTPEIADARANRLRTRLAALAQRFAHAAPVRVFVQIGTDPMFSAGAGAIVTDALSYCGAVNVMASAAVPAPRVSIEGVLAASPDVILSGVSSAQETAALQQFWARRGWPVDAPARLITLDADALYRPTPRMIDAVEALCERLDSVRLPTH